MRTLLFTLAALGWLSADARAQDTPTCTELRPGFVRCTTTHIEGRRPQSWFISSRSRARWEPAPLRRSGAEGAASEVARAVRRDPF